jgi:hypothetical protein
MAGAMRITLITLLSRAWTPTLTDPWRSRTITLLCSGGSTHKREQLFTISRHPKNGKSTYPDNVSKFNCRGLSTAVIMTSQIAKYLAMSNKLWRRNRCDRFEAKGRLRQ